jgi:hypothetical protein
MHMTTDSTYLMQRLLGACFCSLLNLNMYSMYSIRFLEIME